MNESGITITEPDHKLMWEADKLGLDRCYQDLFFHGTGRLHHGYDERNKSKPNGQLVDILEAVAREGIQPQEDIVAKLLLDSAATVSLTRERVYARYYGENFGSDHEGKTHLEYTFGRMEEWRSYFFGETARGMKKRVNASYIPSVLKHVFTRFSLAEIRHAIDVKHHTDRWSVNRAAMSGNHPVIFGVKPEAVVCMDLPHGLNFFEARTAKVISPADVTVIEVPLSKVSAVKEIIAHSNLCHATIVAMEYGEVSSFRKGVKNCQKRQ